MVQATQLASSPEKAPHGHMLGGIFVTIHMSDQRAASGEAFPYHLETHSLPVPHSIHLHFLK